MEKIDKIVPDAICDLIEKVYNGKDNINNKIASLIVTRRNAHGNEKIQNCCNKYLDLLYDEKYKIN